METLVLGPNHLWELGGGYHNGYCGGCLILLSTLVSPLVHSLRIGYLGPGRVCKTDMFLVFQPYILTLDLGWAGGGRLVDRLRQAPSHQPGSS